MNASLVQLRNGFADDGAFVVRVLRVDLVDRVAIQVGVNFNRLPFLVRNLDKIVSKVSSSDCEKEIPSGQAASVLPLFRTQSGGYEPNGHRRFCGI